MMPQPDHHPHVTTDIRRVTPAPVDWLYPDGDVRCDGCGRRIGPAIAMAQDPETGELLCPSCGCDAQDKADEGHPVDDSALPLCERQDGAA